MLQSEVAAKADFSAIRYAQCWEDADVLLAGLDIQPGQTCLSIASAGDNTLAMLSRSPACLIALDLNPAQLACLELRVAAYRVLSHAELLKLIGSTPSIDRQSLYRRCRLHLSEAAQAFWDGHPAEITAGIGSAGKFERYLALFRRRILPLAHNRTRIDQLLAGGTVDRRQAFYEQYWDTWRWRLLFHLFFSRQVMAYLGRDPSFFNYVEGAVSDHILARTHYATICLNPAENPYMQWILTGRHQTALPYALRPENFEAIRANLDRLVWRCQSLESFLEGYAGPAIDGFNLSDIFEYMSLDCYHQLLEKLIGAGHPGSRLAYWNMLVPRRRPNHLAAQLRPLDELARPLYGADKAFFYSDFILEEVSPCRPGSASAWS